MSEETNFLEIKYLEFSEKIEKSKKISEEYSAAITNLKETISKQNDELSKNTEEVLYYEDLIKQSQKDQDYILTDEPLIKATENEEEFNLISGNKSSNSKNNQIELVHERLKSVLDEFDNKMKEIKNIHDKTILKEHESLFFSTVSVSLVEDLFTETGKPQLKLQTFRINSTTTFAKLKLNCLILWDMKEREKEFSLKFVENESLVKIEKENDDINFIDTYLKSRSNVKKAKFVLVSSNNKKIVFEDVTEPQYNNKNKNQNKNKQITNYSSKGINSFLERFVGLAQPMLKQLNIIEHDKLNNKVKKENDKKKSNMLLKISNINSNLNFFLFFVFTIISLIYMRPTEKTYHMHKALQIKFGKEPEKSLNHKTMKEDIMSRITDLFFDPNINRAPITDLNAQISSIRFAFYRTKLKDCKSFLLEVGSINCFYPLYTQETADYNITNSYIIEQEYQNFYTALPLETEEFAYLKYFVVSSNYYNLLLDGYGYQMLFEYYALVFDPFIALEKKNYPIYFEGRLGTYDENTAVDLWMSSAYVNKEVFSTFYDIIHNEENNDINNFFDKGLRAFSISFTLFNNYSQYYFYIHILYEFSSSGEMINPKVTVVPFLINIYESESGKSLHILDIIRIILCVLMFIFTVHSFMYRKNKLHETEKNIINIIKIFFDPKMIANILILLLYIICYATKQIYLTKSTKDLIITTTDNGFLSHNNYEYYSIVANFEFVIVIETIIIFSLFFRIILLFMDTSRINIFFKYIFQAAKNVSVFLFIMMLVIFSNAVFSNNLWGQEYDEYRDLAASMMNILLFSIGHYQKQVLDFSFPIWTIIFTLQFFLVVVYFLMATFVGIYLESYRLNALENGYSYNYRILNSMNGEAEKKKIKKKIKKIK